MDLMDLLKKLEHHMMLKGRKESADLIHKTRQGIAAMSLKLQQNKEQIHAQEGRLYRADAVMHKLPKDADGNPLVPHVDVLWSWTDGEPIRQFPKWERREDTGSKWTVTDGKAIHDVSLCYPTLYAAEAARSEQAEDNGG